MLQEVYITMANTSQTNYSDKQMVKLQLATHLCQIPAAFFRLSFQSAQCCLAVSNLAPPLIEESRLLAPMCGETEEEDMGQSFSHDVSQEDLTTSSSQ